MPIIHLKTRVASTNRIKNQLVSNNDINLLTNRSFLLNAKIAFRAAPASAASSFAWFDHLFDQQNFEEILSPDLSSGMDATHQTTIGLQRARDQNQYYRNNSNNNSNININCNMVSNAHRKIVSVDNDDELNGNDVTMAMNLPMESRIKFRITENPMNAASNFENGPFVQ